MNYLIINGSPHKGNTWVLVEEIKKNITSLFPESIFEEIHLSDLNLPFCLGCSLCFRKGHEHCPHNKIMQNIFDLIDWSDGVVFSATTFNMQPNALTKNLIDHLCFMLHRPYFFTKKALVVSTTGGVGVNKVVKYIAGTLRGLGFNKCYELPVASNSWNAYSINEKIRARCGKIARTFHNDVASMKMYRPTWLILIPYNLFRGMSLSYVKGTEYEYMDGVHWTDPVRAKSTYDPAIPVPFYKKAFGSLFYAIGKIASKFVRVTYRKQTPD